MAKNLLISTLWMLAFTSLLPVHGAPRPNLLRPCTTSGRGIGSILVLPESLPAERVAAGLSKSRRTCLATPEQLADSVAKVNPRRVVYLRGGTDPLAGVDWPRSTALVTYKPLESPWMARHHALTLGGEAQLKVFSRYLSSGKRPAVVIADRRIPDIAHGDSRFRYMAWRDVTPNLDKLCRARRHILVLVSPSRVQQLGHRLAAADGCASHWYFTSAVRTKGSLAPIMAAVAKKELRAYLLDTIGYYRKDPSLIAALGYDTLTELPTGQDSKIIRSLYYVYAALRAAPPSPKQKSYVFRIGETGLTLTRSFSR